MNEYYPEGQRLGTAENRAALRAFSAAAAQHPEAVSPSDRCLAMKAGYFMDRAVHTGMIRAITEELRALPERPWNGLRVITTGILVISGLPFVLSGI